MIGSTATEKHYSPTDVAGMWGLHPNTVRLLFRDEPGVIAIGNKKTTRFRRAKARLCIPESVMRRVHVRLQNP